MGEGEDLRLFLCWWRLPLSHRIHEKSFTFLCNIF